MSSPQSIVPEVTPLSADLSAISVEPLGGLSVSFAGIPSVTHVSVAVTSPVLSEGKLFPAFCEGKPGGSLAIFSCALSSTAVTETCGCEDLPPSWFWAERRRGT